MKKRVLALLLSVLMTLSLLPVSAFAADLDSAELGTEIGTVTGTGEFTDGTADPDTSYEYTIVGDDGSQQTVTVTAAGDTGDVDTTYGTINETTVSSDPYYALVENGVTGIESGKKYLIVSTNSGTGYALTKTAGATAVTIANKNIKSVDTNAVFTLVGSGTSYTLKDSGGTYLNPGSRDFSAQQQSGTAWTVSGNSSVQFNYASGRTTYYITFSSRSNGFSYSSSTTYWSSRDLYLFVEVPGTEKDVFKVNWTTAADTLLAACNGLTKDNYTEDSWTPFQKALKAANAAHDAESFATETEAQAALATMPALKAAYDALEAAEVFYPTITWKRTLEPKYGTTYRDGVNGELVRDLQYIQASDLQTISWDGTDVIKLDTDDSMTVWDYNTDQQYSNASKTNGISAATWQHWYNTQNNWKYADVRKISGTFTWPEGYDLDDTITLISANDSNYTPIYEYIAANETYSARVGDRKIIAINDDMYVYVYVDDDKPTSLTDNSYLAFYTGSVGKGIWSDVNYTNDDWGRTEPSSYNGTYATYAFHGVYPNLADDTNKTGVVAIDNASYLNHTDGWYTFVDGSTISTVLKNHYGNESLDNRTVHIDIYCFDNSKNGGMDELKLMLKKAPKQTATVTVEYYLNSLNTANLLGTSTMPGQKIGEPITLDNGFDVNQLNFKKAEAIVKAGNKNVTDGVQQGTVPYVVVEGDNVIKVLYTTLDSKVIRVVADDGRFSYDDSAKTVPTYKVYMNGQELTRRNDGTYQTTDGNFIQDVIVTTGSGTNPGKYENGINYNSTVTVKNAQGNNVSNSYTFYEEPGIITIEYTPADAAYTYDFGVSNQYNGVFDTVELNAKITTTNTSVVIDKANNNTITYTPETVNTGETVDLTLTFTGGYSVTKKITFLPESNVMYEENMVTADGSSWEKASDTSGATLTADKLVTKHDDAYGYTDAYADDTKFSSGSALRATLTEKQVTGTATFTFTGTGFDLISECGTDTGMLVVGVKNASTNEAVCGYLVDTYFCGDKEYVTADGDNILAYQVPVVRNLELDYGRYTVTVAGYLASNAGALTKNAVATQSLSNAAPSVDEIFRAAGMSEYLDAGVEVSFMDDNSVLNGGTGPAVTVATPSFFSRVRSFFRGLASTQAATAESGSKIYAYIDAFRVYQPLESDPDVYEPTEKGTNYYSLYDFVKNSVNDLEEYTSDVAVYIEYDGSTGVANIADYKDQGPENEVYLAPGSAIIFGLQDYEDGDTVQVSAKQIGNVTAGGISMVSTSTEMYYDVDDVAYDDLLGVYYVIISNDKDSTGILALSALKVSSHIAAVASEELGNRVVEIIKDNADAFKPATLTVSAPESTKANRSYTIKVQSSKDVAYITIKPNGEDEVTLNPTNKKAVDAGRVQYYTFSKAYKQAKAGDYTYTVTAYDSAGNASAPVTVTVTVK